MRGRLYERMITGRFGSDQVGTGRRGARDIDIEVASHHRTVRTPSVGSTRPIRIF